MMTRLYLAIRFYYSLGYSWRLSWCLAGIDRELENWKSAK